MTSRNNILDHGKIVRANENGQISRTIFLTTQKSPKGPSRFSGTTSPAALRNYSKLLSLRSWGSSTNHSLQPALKYSNQKTFKSWPESLHPTGPQLLQYSFVRPQIKTASRNNILVHGKKFKPNGNGQISSTVF